jgi:protein-L-isoaspartate(D-aspartate) O-methyltransferase
MRNFEDSYLHKGLRKKLVDQIREKGITDEHVLQAINNVPRHYFLDSAFERHAYEDRAFPIGEDQTISQPYTVAYQTQLLQIKPFEKILEVGTGSAYQASVLAELKAKVYSIERQKKLFDANKKFEFLKQYDAQWMGRNPLPEATKSSKAFSASALISFQLANTINASYFAKVCGFKSDKSSV